ncbi:hypothetical protein [Limosilactobacillus agrestimuris]|uniref:hypothetical protein n=1 Tax=Limosilactobacillus agrestimuris TaxID=2941331 RepID=UPI00203DC827|nr:hypothetical protein [Limosilactobacillus agrestimuris]
MDCITEDFKAALRSLDKRNHYGIDGWGKPHEKLEDILSPDDWRLKAIKAFRRRIKITEDSRESRVINDIRGEIGKRGITDKGVQIDYLYSIGLGCTRIGKILKLSHNTVADRILKLRKENPSVQGKNSIHYIDALVLMRNGMTGIDDKTFKSYQY